MEDFIVASNYLRQESGSIKSYITEMERVAIMIMLSILNVLKAVI